MKRLLILLLAVAAAVPLAQASPSNGPSAVRTTAVCHRVASANRPYVKLRLTARQLRAHQRHAADIIPAPRGACPRTVLTPSSGGVSSSVALTGETEMPAGDPVGTGTATVRLRRNQGQLCFTLDVQNLGSPAAAAHIHRGAAGVAGAIVVPLTTPNQSGSSRGCVAAPRTIVNQILASRAGFYVNVHTAEFPDGAVRGQVAGTSETALGRTFSLQLSGSDERPSGDADGTGTAVLRVRRSDGRLCFRLTVQNVQLPAVGAHIHRAPAGSNGPIVVPFATSPAANGVASGCETVDGALLDEILANPAGFYVNVHTREYPGGAVRAQLA